MDENVANLARRAAGILSPEQPDLPPLVEARAWVCAQAHPSSMSGRSSVSSSPTLSRLRRSPASL